MSTRKPRHTSLLTRLRTQAVTKFPVIPPGWKPASQWAREWGVGRTTAYRLLTAGERTGAIQSKIFKIRSRIGSGIVTVHYREK